MGRLHSIIIFGLLALPATEGHAWDYRLTSSTHFSGRVLPGSSGPTTHMPLTEFIRLRARDLGVDGLSVEAAVWGQVEFLDVIDDRVTGDVTTLSLEYKGPHESVLRGLRIRLGRQFISAGPSILEQLDGGMMSYTLPMGLQLAAFGGVPTGIRFLHQPWVVGPHEDEYGGNWVVGGRLGYNFRDMVGVGVAYRHKRYRGLVAHHELGWDLTAAPFPWLEVLADGAVELTVERLKEIRAGVILHPMRELDLEAGYRFVSPDLYVPRSSIFAVFSDDVHQQAYVEAHWARWRWLELSAEAAVRIYDETCSDAAGKSTCDDAVITPSAALRAVLRLGPERQHRLVLEAERIGTPDGGLTRVRVGTRMPIIGKLSVAVDADAYLLDEEDEGSSSSGAGTNWSFAGSGYLSYALPHNLSVLAGGQAMVTPIFSNQGSFMVRLNWLMDGASASSKVASSKVAVQRSAMSTAGGAL